MLLNMNIPSESIPALLGRQGSKLKSICGIFSTEVRIYKEESALSEITISGQDLGSIEKTKSLICLAVRHYLSSTEELSNIKTLQEEPDICDAEMDIRAFFAETHSRK